MGWETWLDTPGQRRTGSRVARQKSWCGSHAIWPLSVQYPSTAVPGVAFPSPPPPEVTRMLGSASTCRHASRREAQRRPSRHWPFRFKWLLEAAGRCRGDDLFAARNHKVLPEPVTISMHRRTTAWTETAPDIFFRSSYHVGNKHPACARCTPAGQTYNPPSKLRMTSRQLPD